MEPHYVSDTATLYRGDALAVLQSLPSASVDGSAPVAGAAGTAAKGDPSDSGAARPLGRAARLLTSGPSA